MTLLDKYDSFKIIFRVHISIDNIKTFEGALSIHWHAHCLNKHPIQAGLEPVAYSLS